MVVEIYPSDSFVEFTSGEIEQSIASCFEKQVENYPNKLAIKTKTDILTYDRLNRLANQIAHLILEKIGPSEKIVALLFEPNITIAAAIFGTLKAGKSFVTVDPSYPQARISYILEDSQTELILTNKRNFSLAKNQHLDISKILNIDTLDSSISDENINLSISPDAPAYLLYTSGSTGQPKGVLHNQRNMLHYVMTYTNATKICVDDRLSLFGSLSHTAGITDIFRALLKGAAILPFNIKEEGLAQLASWLIREEITIFHSVPTVFRHFVDIFSGKETFPQIRLIHLGGEPVSSRDVDMYKKHFASHCILLNNLSSTEVSIYRQCFIDKKTELTGSIVPVGYPVKDKIVILIDEAGQEVGFNEVGEIAVKSPYLAVEYWQRPELTKEAFRPVPGQPDVRIYHTGDLGRMQPDGCLVHLGRKDAQVKIRGFRIEITEVETTLSQFSQIKEVAVVAHDNKGDKRLVAYIVPYSDKNPSISELKRFMQDRVPDYMVPTAFVYLDKLPLNANNKVDRRALPNPNEATLKSDNTFVAPRTPLERQLTKLWETILDIPHIGIEDSFFDLGGNSMLAIRLLTQIEQDLGKRLPVTVLVESPTIAQLANIINDKSWHIAWSPLVTIQAGQDRPPFFCVHGWGGGVIGYTDLAHLLGPEQPFYGLQARGVDGLQEPQTRIEDMATEYIQAVRTVQPTGPYYLGGYCQGGIIAYQMAQELQTQGEKVNFLALFDAYAPINVSKWEIVRRPNYMVNFLTNSGYWLKDFWQLGYQGMAVRLQRKTNNTWKRIVSQQKSSPQLNIDDLLDDSSHIPEQHRKLMEIHSRARRNYVPQIYDGPVTLFRIRGLSPFRSYDPTLGWQRLAKGGVDVKTIPGAHGNLLERPHVYTFAKLLKPSLEQSQAMTT